MRGAAVARHPDVDYVISLFKKGLGARAISNIINDKYKNNKRFCLSWIVLNDFAKNFLNLSREDRIELRAMAREKGDVVYNEKDLALQSRMQRKTAILDIEEQLAERRLDTREELEKLFDTALTEIDSINLRVKDMKQDRDFVAGKATLISAIEQVRKILVDVKNEQDDTSRAAESSGPGNVVIQFGHVDGYVKAMKQAIVETFRELGYLKELPMFLDKLSGRLAKINSIEIRDATGASLRVSNEGALKALGGGDDQ